MFKCANFTQGRPHRNEARKRSWFVARCIFASAGLLSLIWFLVRVIPKPSRAAYPCQRAAAPLASTFVLWLLAMFGCSFSYRTGKRYWRRSRFLKALTCFCLAVLGFTIMIINIPHIPIFAADPVFHGPIGTAKGIFPGRVVWIHAPEATDWEGYDSLEHWWEAAHTDLAVVAEMMSQAIQNTVGASTDKEAWEAIFKHFNDTRGHGLIPYQAGEKIAIKINLTTCNARGEQVDTRTYNKNSAIMNRIDNSPQMILTLLRQLVYTVGVEQADITVGDPTGLFPNFMWNMLHPEFPDVHYLDNHGGSGRRRARLSQTPFNWSAPSADSKRQDYLPEAFADAKYLINFAVLKGHSSGITVCAKNHYGSLLRCPDGYMRGAGILDYYDMHLSLPNPGWSPGTGKYRALVDLMGHKELGGKTLIYLIDGLFGGYYWESRPYKWKSAPFGDGAQGDWPSSLFASLDGVAIDSVAHDFLLVEWPRVVTGGTGAAGTLQGGAEDYLHEATLAADPPSGISYDPDRDGVGLQSLGTHEHWNNVSEKQYSRNLGLDKGIELLAISVDRPAPKLLARKIEQGMLISWPDYFSDCILQTTDKLQTPANWQTVTTTPIIAQGRHKVVVTPNAQAQFYRLVQ
jgi:hypothetical protein